MALLGKISAVLTANTQDFTRRIGESRRELQDFARQARGVQFNLNTRALDGTLTQLQRFQRLLRQIEDLRSRGIDAGLPDPRRLRDQFRVFEDIGKPLTALKNQIEGFSTSVQASLYPALSGLQNEFQRLFAEIDAGTTTLDASGQRIDALRRGLVALGRATAISADFKKLAESLEAKNAGADFFNPRAKESLTAALALRKKAAEIPARLRSDVFADLAVTSERNAALIERAAARVVAAQVRIAREGETSETLTARGVAQQRLDALVRIQEATNMSFQREISSAEIKQIISPDAVSRVDQLTDKFGALSARLREGGDQRFDGLIASVGRVIEQLNRTEGSAKKAKLAIAALAGADATKAFNASRFDSADKLIRSESERTIDKIRRDAQTQRNNIIGDRPQLGRRRSAAVEGVNLQENIALAGEEFNRTAAERVGDLSSRTKTLKDAGLAAELDKIRNLAVDVNGTLKRAFDAKDTKAGEQALDDYRSKFPKLVEEIDKFEKKLKSSETAKKRFEQFLTLSGSRSDKLGADLERAASDITVARQFAGNFGAGNIAGRRNVATEIEKQIGVYQRLAELQQRIFDKDFKNEGAKLKAIQKVSEAVVQQRQILKDTVVNNSGGLVNAQQFDTAADKAAKNAGSFGVRGAAVAQLAFQQGLFAIDDLISSTGGLEYKLRAVGNNITQLGLLLGQSGVIPGLTATTGLFVGLSVVLGGQALSTILRWATGAEEADARAKALNDSLARQKSLVESLVQAFGSLGDSIAGKGFSSAGQSARAFRKELSEIDRKQRELRGERVSFLDPQVQSERAKQATLRKRLDSSQDGGQRVAILREIEESRRKEREAIRARVGAAAPSTDAVRASVVNSIRDSEFARLTEEKGGLFPVRLVDDQARREAAARRSRAARDLDAAGSDPLALSRVVEQRIKERTQTASRDIGALDFFTGDAVEITNAREDVAALTTLLESLRLPASLQADKAIQDIFKSASEAASAIEESQRQVADAIKAGVPSAISLQGLLDRLADEIDSAQNEIRSAQEDFAKSGLTQEDVALRDSRIEAARKRIDRGEGRRRQAREEANALEQNSILNPQSSLDFRFRRISGVLSSGGIEDGIAANELRKLEARRASVVSQLAADPTNPFVRRRSEKELEEIRNSTAKVESLATSAAAAAAALDRLSNQLVDTVAQEARSSADEARLAEARAFASRDLGRPGADVRQAMERTIRLEAEAREAEDDAQRLRYETTQARQKFERQAAAGEIGDDLRRLIRRRDEAQRILDDENATTKQKQDAAMERDAANRAIGRRFEDSPEGLRAKDRADDAAARAQESRLLDESILRGRELLKTPLERAREEAGQRAFDLSKELDKQGANRAERDAAFSREALAQAMQVAPMLMGFRDERMNALLQGPSRAALNAADVNTMEGQRELNRLLRGDDPNKDVNLVEMQKQSELLQGVIDAIKQQEQGATVEIRG